MSCLLVTSLGHMIHCWMKIVSCIHLSPKKKKVHVLSTCHLAWAYDSLLNYSYSEDPWIAFFPRYNSAAIIFGLSCKITLIKLNHFSKTTIFFKIITNPRIAHKSARLVCFTIVSLFDCPIDMYSCHCFSVSSWTKCQIYHIMFCNFRWPSLRKVPFRIENYGLALLRWHFYFSCKFYNANLYFFQTISSYRPHNFHIVAVWLIFRHLQENQEAWFRFLLGA